MSSPSTGTSVSWPYAAAGILAGVGAGYALGVASSRWLFPGETTRPNPVGSSPQRQQVLSSTATGNLVAAIVELTAEVARLRQTVETAELLSRLPPSRRSTRGGGSTADFVSAQGDNPESDEDYFEPNEQEEGEGEGLTMSPPTPNFTYLDDLGRSTQGSQDTCLTLTQQIKAAMTEFPDNVGLLWRLARVLFHLSNHLEQDGDTTEQKKLIKEASEHAQQALELDESVWQAHQWYAIAIGSLSKYESTQKKIEMGYKYKEHIDRAISLNPGESTLHHLRGRFCFEVAGVSWLEKKAAAALFGSPPESTYQEALDNLLKAEDLRPGVWKMNALVIGKCHLKMSDVPTAVEWLHKAYNIPTNTPEDCTAQVEVEELLTQYDPNFTDDSS